MSDRYGDAAEPFTSTMQELRFKMQLASLFQRAIEMGGWPVLGFAEAISISIEAVGELCEDSEFRERLLNGRLTEFDSQRAVPAIQGKWEAKEPKLVEFQNMWTAMRDWLNHLDDDRLSKLWNAILETGDFQLIVNQLIEVRYWTRERALRITNLKECDLWCRSDDSG
ncbi:MAG: hypothetical protein Q8K78_17810 [Planctomycetaceae bacterium]|nr:hypothetical protein [Planctomycetaceae bacterium]